MKACYLTYLGKDKTNSKVCLWDLLAWDAKKFWGKGIKLAIVYIFKLWYRKLPPPPPRPEAQSTLRGCPGLHPQRGLSPGNSEKRETFISHASQFPTGILLTPYLTPFLWPWMVPNRSKSPVHCHPHPRLLCTLRLWSPGSNIPTSPFLLISPSDFLGPLPHSPQL